MGQRVTQRALEVSNYPHSTIEESPFRLTYGTKAIILVEFRESTRQTESPLDKEMNNEALREELDLVEEIQLGQALCKAKLK